MACTKLALPALEADFCAPNLNFGRIDKVYIGAIGFPLSDVADAAAWALRLDNAAAPGDTVIRELNVLGDKPLPERTELTYSLGRKTYTVPKHTVNVTVDETGALNYAFLLLLEQNAGKPVAIWYASGKYLYGGAAGIPAVLTLGDVIPQSVDELATFQGTIYWEGDHPARITNPLPTTV